jgi:uncharacterized protein
MTQKPLVEYPTTYIFKVMGKRTDDFADHVRRTFGRVLGRDIDPSAVTHTVSQKGSYVSMTIAVHLESETQRQAIYAEIHQDERVVYYL